MSNNKSTYNIIATFFVNELLTVVLPNSRINLLERYRDNIDDYFNSLSMFATGTNPAYEVVLGKLVAFHNKYLEMSKNLLIERICSDICSSGGLQKLKYGDKYSLFKKFILECCKTFVAVSLSNSATYISFCEKESLNEKEKNMLKTFKQNTVRKFEKIIENNRNQLYSQFMCLERGENPELIDTINSESKLLEELRKQNEEMRFTILKLKEEILKLKGSENNNSSNSPSSFPVSFTEPENEVKETREKSEKEEEYEWD